MSVNGERFTLELPADAPRGATAVGRPGSPGTVEANGAKVALATWDEQGRLLWTVPLDRDGKRHGVEREIEEGRTVWLVPWDHGTQHGLAQHLATDGALLATSVFVRGKGVDVYCEADGSLSEYREIENDVRHGIERWGDPTCPYIEEHLHRGRDHGIRRRWHEGRLEAGYPRYFVDGEEVPRERYVQAALDRPELPPDLRHEDEPARTLPAPLVDGRVRLFPRR